MEADTSKILSPNKETTKLIDMSMEEDKDMGEGEDDEEMMLDEENAIDEAFEPDLDSNIPLTQEKGRTTISTLLPLVAYEDLYWSEIAGALKRYGGA